MMQSPAPITFQSGAASLAGSLYRPEVLKGAVMIAPATGIRRGFYARFATFLQSRGYGVLTFDNHGIGDSTGGRTGRSDATLLSWGQSDMPAALEALRAAFPNTSYHLVGHSAGGQLIGLMPNAERLDSIVTVASSSGSLRHMHGRFRWSALFFLRVLLPMTAAVFGAGRSDWVRMGGPLPPGVARQWSAWCRGRGYVEEALRTGEVPHCYDRLEQPTLWLHASDDDIANTANVQDMLRVYTRLKPEVRRLDPHTYGLRAIGHMGLFRHDALWPEVAAWLDETSRGGIGRHAPAHPAP